MKATRPSEVRALLAEMSFRPSRLLGQHFLVDDNILSILLEAAAVGPSDLVLEVGPGLGVLTGPLLERARKVIALERDRRLADWLRTRYGDSHGLDLRVADVMDLDLEALLEEGVTKVVANLPYAVASRLLVDLSQAFRRPGRIVVTVQREVADRLCARVGTRDFGVLGLLVQLHYEVSVRKGVSRTCFWPPPRVASAIVELRARTAPAAVLHRPDLYRELVRYAFSQRRKQIGAILQRAPRGLRRTGESLAAALTASGIEPAQRPETISLAAWCRLADLLGEGETGGINGT